MEKIKVSRKVVGFVDLNCSTLGSIKKKIEGYIETYGEDATLQTYYEYSDDPDWGVFVKELETDPEYALRIRKKEQQEEWERLQYQILKAKFNLDTD